MALLNCHLPGRLFPDTLSNISTPSHIVCCTVFGGFLLLLLFRFSLALTTNKHYILSCPRLRHHNDNSVRFAEGFICRAKNRAWHRVGFL